MSPASPALPCLASVLLWRCAPSTAAHAACFRPLALSTLTRKHTSEVLPSSLRNFRCGFFLLAVAVYSSSQGSLSHCGGRCFLDRAGRCGYVSEKGVPLYSGRLIGVVLLSLRSFDCPDKSIFTEILGSPKESHAAHSLRSISQTAHARHFGLKAISLRVKHVWTVICCVFPRSNKTNCRPFCRRTTSGAALMVHVCGSE